MRKLLLILVFTLPGIAWNYASGQVTAENYIDLTKDEAMIFNGPLAQKYTFLHSGTYYYLNNEFSENDLYYNGKLYRVELNLNANSDELILKLPESRKLIVANRSMVGWFTLDSRKFIGVDDGEFSNLHGGYYEALYEGNGLALKKLNKIFKDRIKDNKIDYSFIALTNRYIVKDGVAYPINSVRDLARIYKEQGQNIRKFLKEKGSKFSAKRNIDSALSETMKFIEQLSE